MKPKKTTARLKCVNRADLGVVTAFQSFMDMRIKWTHEERDRMVDRLQRGPMEDTSDRSLQWTVIGLSYFTCTLQHFMNNILYLIGLYVLLRM